MQIIDAFLLWDKPLVVFSCLLFWRDFWYHGMMTTCTELYRCRYGLTTVPMIDCQGHRGVWKNFLLSTLKVKSLSLILIFLYPGRLRFLRYNPGQYFKPHFDGMYERTNGERSFITLQLYLNEVRLPLTYKCQDSLLVRVPDSWSKGCEFESPQEWWEHFLLQS